MTGWITATGRTVGMLTCSAMLLISATLGQSGQVSPPRSFSLAGFEMTGSQEATSSQSQSPAVTPESADTTAGESQQTGSTADSGKSQSGAEQQQPQSSNQESYSIAPTNPVPRAGSGFVVPEDDRLRFNKAIPVRMSPVRIQIPDAWVDASIQTVGVTPEGEMEAPDGFWNVGWYRYGTRPGDAGKAVMAGHYDSYDGAAVFYHLDDLEPGDEIRILLGGPDGERFYRVREVAHYHVDDAPLDRIFGPSDNPELILITCGGDWLGADAGGYTDRIVVYADMIVPVEPETAEAPGLGDLRH